MATPPLACVEYDKLFLHPLLEDTRSATTSALRTQQRMMTERARTICQGCPLLEQCRFDAVVKHDVSGFVAGCTESERNEIRRMLKIKVAPEDFDVLAGAFTPNRQVNHADVIRLRASHPNETLEQLASRLGCSLSTIKRHLRKARASSVPDRKRPKPTVEDVTYAASMLRSAPAQRRAA